MHVIKDTNTDNQLTLHTIKVIHSFPLYLFVAPKGNTVPGKAQHLWLGRCIEKHYICPSP